MIEIQILDELLQCVSGTSRISEHIMKSPCYHHLPQRVAIAEISMTVRAGVLLSKNAVVCGECHLGNCHGIDVAKHDLVKKEGLRRVAKNSVFVTIIHFPLAARLVGAGPVVGVHRQCAVRPHDLGKLAFLPPFRHWVSGIP